MSDIIKFYGNEIPANDKYYLYQIWTWDNDRLEQTHDYIQWMFPLTEPSAADPNAPILSLEDIRLFRSNKDLQKRLIISFHTMRRFLETAGWLQQDNHNRLRITRILKSLNILGQRDIALVYLSYLKTYIDLYGNIHEGNLLSYWNNAVAEDFYYGSH